VSVTALSDQFKPILWELKPSQRESVRQLARELLNDVGRPDSDFEDVQDKSYQIISNSRLKRRDSSAKPMHRPQTNSSFLMALAVDTPFTAQKQIELFSHFCPPPSGLCG
jgi:hypothetical protein